MEKLLSFVFFLIALMLIFSIARFLLKKLIVWIVRVVIDEIKKK